MQTARPYLIVTILGFLTLVALLIMGRNLMCSCGYVSLWGGNAPADQGSQHLFDWYTPSHLLHGFLFYGALFLLARGLSYNTRLYIAVVIECVWEVVENSAWVIERYRSTTVSVDYNGDSIVNSAGDIFAMVLGFWLSRVLPVWTSGLIVIGFEVLTIYLIRDGLALNILMLLWPLEAVRDWQMGG